MLRLKWVRSRILLAGLELRDLLLIRSMRRLPDGPHRRLLVLAGIAASDSACTFRLGRYSRGQAHGDATVLLTSIELAGNTRPET